MNFLFGLVISLIALKQKQSSARASGLAYALAFFVLEAFSRLVIPDEQWNHYYALAILLDAILAAHTMPKLGCRVSNKIFYWCIVSAIVNLFGLILWLCYASPFTYNLSMLIVMAAIALNLLGGTSGPDWLRDRFGDCFDSWIPNIQMRRVSDQGSQVEKC